MSKDLDKLVATMYGLPVFQTDVYYGSLKMHAGGKISRYLDTLEQGGYIKSTDFAALRTICASNLAFVHGSPVLMSNEPHLKLDADVSLLIRQAEPSGQFSGMPTKEFQELVLKESRQFMALIKRNTNNAFKYIKRTLEETSQL